MKKIIMMAAMGLSLATLTACGAATSGAGYPDGMRLSMCPDTAPVYDSGRMEVSFDQDVISVIGGGTNLVLKTITTGGISHFLLGTSNGIALNGNELKVTEQIICASFKGQI